MLRRLVHPVPALPAALPAAARLVALGRDAALDLSALVAPVECAGCGAYDRALCPSCAAQLAPTPRTALLEVAPRTHLPLVAGIAYDGVARAALLALKEDGRTELARPLRAPLLAALELTYSAPAAQGAVLVTIPGSRAALGRRGFHPVELLARRAGLEVTRALELAPERGRGNEAATPDGPSRGAVSQKSRSLEARIADRREPRVTRDVAGRTVVLLDDVVTSGATLRAAARALARAGAAVAGGAAIAATPRRWGESAIRWVEIGTVSDRIGDAPGMVRERP